MRRALLLLPTVLLVGCSGAAVSPVTTAIGPSFTAPETAASQVVSSSPAVSPVLIAFVRSGGFIGVADHLTIAQDGTFTLLRARPAVSRSGQLAPEDLARVRDLLADPGLSGLPAQRPVTGNDRYSYRLTFDGHRVAAQDGGVAGPLRPLIAALVGMLATYGS